MNGITKKIPYIWQLRQIANQIQYFQDLNKLWTLRIQDL